MHRATQKTTPQIRFIPGRSVVVVMVVVIMVAALARCLLGSGLGPLDGGRPHERIRAQHNATADRLAGCGVLRERMVLDGLANFVTPPRSPRAGQGFINVGDHNFWKDG